MCRWSRSTGRLLKTSGLSNYCGSPNGEQSSISRPCAFHLELEWSSSAWPFVACRCRGRLILLLFQRARTGARFGLTVEAEYRDCSEPKCACAVGLALPLGRDELTFRGGRLTAPPPVFADMRNWATFAGECPLPAITCSAKLCHEVQLAALRGDAEVQSMVLFDRLALNANADGIIRGVLGREFSCHRAGRSYNFMFVNRGIY
jgi:hypothetical protein